MECLKDIATGGQRITLVTGDKAFWNKKKSALNESLANELTNAGIPSKSLLIQSKLERVIDSQISSNLSSVEWVATVIEGGGIEDFVADNDAVLLKVTDWVIDDPGVFDDPYRGGIAEYSFVEFDVIEEVRLESIERTLDLGNGEVLVDSRWTCEAAVQGHTHPDFGESLTVTLQFTLSSIVETNKDQLSVRSHQVTDVSVDDFIRTEPAFWPDGSEAR